MRPDARPEVLGALALVSQPAALPALAGEPAEDPSLVVGHGDPAEEVVAHDRRMCPLDEDDLEPVVLAVLRDPVGVEHFAVRESPVDALLCEALVVLREHEVPAEVPGLAACPYLRAHMAAAEDAVPHDDDALLRPIAQGAGPVDARRTVYPQRGEIGRAHV